MPRIIPNKAAIDKANEEFFRLHPERKNRPLTATKEDAKLRIEWLKLFQKYGGKVEQRKPGPVSPGAKLTNVCQSRAPDSFSVYVYVYKAAADGHGHVGMVLKQKNGSYIRYSQAAENPNLQGWDRWEYLLPAQKVKVRTRIFPKNTNPKSFAGGSSIIGIPTKHLEKIQNAVNAYIRSDNNYYHVVTNNCADFVNDTINAADDIDISDKTIPVDYYNQLAAKYKGCEVR